MHVAPSPNAAIESSPLIRPNALIAHTLSNANISSFFSTRAPTPIYESISQTDAYALQLVALTPWLHPILSHLALTLSTGSAPAAAQSVPQLLQFVPAPDVPFLCTVAVIDVLTLAVLIPLLAQTVTQYAAPPQAPLSNLPALTAA